MIPGIRSGIHAMWFVFINKHNTTYYLGQNSKINVLQKQRVFFSFVKLSQILPVEYSNIVLTGIEHHFAGSMISSAAFLGEHYYINIY